MQQRIHFNNRHDHKIAGILHLPDTGEIRAYALFAHCFTCTKNINSATNIAGALAKQGIATLNFDFTGLGASKGDFADSTFSTDIEDLIDAAQFLQHNYRAPQLLVGHSLGGTAVLAASKSIPSANAIVSIASPANPSHILHLLENHLDELKEKGEATLDLAGRPFTFNQGFVDDANAHSIDFRSLGKALMVLHSPQDTTVSIDEASKIFGQAMHPKSFVSLDRMDHLLVKSEDARYVGNILAAWAERYLDVEELEVLDVGDDGVYVNGKTAESFLCHVGASGHDLLADEPISIGGTNLGPTPYDYLAGGLGACTAMTLNMYARLKKLDVTDVGVLVEHDRIHAEDCVDCEKQNGKIDVFTRTISISGNIDEQVRQRMLQIADRCPVHKTLENEIKIETKLTSPS
jgi:putative redox protein